MQVNEAAEMINPYCQTFCDEIADTADGESVAGGVALAKKNSTKTTRKTISLQRFLKKMFRTIMVQS